MSKKLLGTPGIATRSKDGMAGFFVYLSSWWLTKVSEIKGLGRYEWRLLGATGSKGHRY